jgi:hypothetical protein
MRGCGKESSLFESLISSQMLGFDVPKICEMCIQQLFALMKHKLKIFIIAYMALAFMVACSSDSTDAPQNIRWYSLNDGLIVASELDKKVLVYFWAKW